MPTRARKEPTAARIETPRAQATLAASTQALLDGFIARRPLRGGSLLVTIFGDAIAPRGGAVALGPLIRLAAPFGLTERLVRTSVGRLARDGLLAQRSSGRRSEYRLSAQGQHQFAEATRRIYASAPQAWDGQWTLLLAPAAKRAEPGSAKSPNRRLDALRWRGFGEVSPRVFVHPDSGLCDARGWLADLGLDADLLVLKVKADEAHRAPSCKSGSADQRLARLGWDLAGLDERYRAFLDLFEPIGRALGKAPPSALAPRSAFVIRTLLIHDYRKIHLQDPLLPAVLLPPHSIGSRAYALCRHVYAAVLRQAEQFLSVTGSTLDGPLPPADAALHLRFGGLGELPRP